MVARGDSLAWFGTGRRRRGAGLPDDGSGRSWAAVVTPLAQGTATTGTASVAFLDDLRGAVMGGDVGRAGQADRQRRDHRGRRPDLAARRAPRAAGRDLRGRVRPRRADADARGGRPGGRRGVDGLRRDVDDDRHARPLERDVRRDPASAGRWGPAAASPASTSRAESPSRTRFRDARAISTGSRRPTIAAGRATSRTPWRETLARVDIGRRVRDVLDVGCGTGALPRRDRRGAERERRGPRLAGVDLSHGMLAVARGKLGRRGALVVADAAGSPSLRAGSTSRSRRARSTTGASRVGALREMARVLRPAGRVAITDWCGDRWVERLRSRILRRHEHDRLRVYRSAELAALLEERDSSTSGRALADRMAVEPHDRHGRASRRMTGAPAPGRE